MHMMMQMYFEVHRALFVLYAVLEMQQPILVLGVQLKVAICGI